MRNMANLHHVGLKPRCEFESLRKGPGAARKLDLARHGVAQAFAVDVVASHQRHAHERALTRDLREAV